eukprot:TRINITY_DN19732_c0_g1_i1.p1 TRINITY_DN19732_c0_g1~~TRINITY_DN19732_c0_g1_i1.p1  ORF type:complete len:460 (+),score=87.51 TRINITY_DN19732_c0_g1_i1:64-1443(+)
MCIRDSSKVPTGKEVVANPNPIDTTAISRYLLGEETIEFTLSGPDTKKLRLAVTALIGSGGESFVYQAYCVDNLADLVVKVPREIPVTDHEISIQTKLFNANPRLFTRFVGQSSFVHGGQQINISIEEFEAASLQDVLFARKNLVKIGEKAEYSEDEVGHLLHQLVEMLTVFEETKIFHNDIKTGNILVDSKTYLNIKLTDFGISVKAPGYTRGNVTEVIGIGGFSEDYSSPEKIEAYKHPDKTQKFEVMESEIYSMGCVLQEVLSVSCIAAKEKYGPTVEAMTNREWRNRITLQKLQAFLNTTRMNRNIQLSYDYDVILGVERGVLITKWLKVEKIRQTLSAVRRAEVYLHERRQKLVHALIGIEYCTLTQMYLSAEEEDNIRKDEIKKKIEVLGLGIEMSNKIDDTLKREVVEQKQRLEDFDDNGKKTEMKERNNEKLKKHDINACLLYTSPSPRDS